MPYKMRDRGMDCVSTMEKQIIMEHSYLSLLLFTVFVISEESIASATKLPRIGDRWFKHHQLPSEIYNKVFKIEF
jgi:hypothetical protein